MVTIWYRALAVRPREIELMLRDVIGGALRGDHG
jgi:hypothetical protein